MMDGNGSGSTASAPPLGGGLNVRLSLMMFLQYAIWGAWLPLLWPFLNGSKGFDGGQIGNIFAIGAVWSERKVSAHMQCRLGPMEVGPHGILQTVADGLKLLAKEDIIPRLADKPLFVLAPAIVFAGVLMRFVPLPFGDQLIASDLDLGLFFIAAVGAVEVLGVIMAGWSSNNKWSLFGT
ncbi:MAG TPA: hypothetical protein EYN79_05355, partial [Planctomycetes bacterium]|nr:hypothetical protein [Planctomycetota bacterium]